MRKNANNSGFALIIVLVVLTIAGTILAAAARRCGSSALAAGASERKLQVKWGSLSCRKIGLAAAEDILQADANRSDAPAITARRKIVLGGMNFDLIIADEQAKANVNLMTHRLGPEVATAAIGELQSRIRNPLPIRLRPSKIPPSETKLLPIRFVGVDQVFQYRHPTDLLQNETSEPTTLD